MFYRDNGKGNGSYYLGYRVRVVPSELPDLGVQRQKAILKLSHPFSPRTATNALQIDEAFQHAQPRVSGFDTPE